MRRLILALVASSSVLLASGCSLMAPQYTTNIDNVQKLKDNGEFSAKVGKFDSDKNDANANPITLRGSPLRSPYGDSYAEYVAEAIKQELSLAGKLKPTADVEISGVLLKNDIDARGFSKANGDIEVRFVVKKGLEVRYDQIKTVHYEWESSFLGPVAIPRAQQEYPNLVRKLLEALLADPAFLQALK